MGVILLAILALGAGPAEAQTRAKRPAAPAAPAFFTTPLALEEMRGKQAVVTTSAGTFVIQLLPDRAPNHVGHFIKLAGEDAYDGTTFHRAIRYGIIQGGDPLSKDPSKRDLFGTGGLGVLKAEFSEEPMTKGAVAAVLQPGKADSGGAQFFIAVTDQTALTGQYTIFGRVVRGLEVAAKISEADVDANARVVDRIEIRDVVIRDAPPPEPDPFSTETVAELAAQRAVLETSLGEITLELWPDKAPGHVRNFLRLAVSGVYDGTSFHRVVPGFVVQTGMVSTRLEPLTQKQQGYVRTLAPEFNDTVHVAGTLSMARLDDPASASTSFFICTAPAPSLDGKYTAFGQVVDGLDVLRRIEAVELNGEAPRTRVELRRVRLERARQ